MPDKSDLISGRDYIGMRISSTTSWTVQLVGYFTNAISFLQKKAVELPVVKTFEQMIRYVEVFDWFRNKKKIAENV